jgi:hypothetical protein
VPTTRVYAFSSVDSSKPTEGDISSATNKHARALQQNLYPVLSILIYFEIRLVSWLGQVVSKLHKYSSLRRKAKKETRPPDTVH